MNPIVITGASGFLGAHLAYYLAKSGYQVVGTYYRNAIPDVVRVELSEAVALDLSDEQATQSFFKRTQPRFVIHTAALASSVLCEQEPGRARQINITATSMLCRFLSSCPCYYISTDLVFDGLAGKRGGFSEGDRPEPKSVYAKTKHEAEHIVLASGGFVFRTALIYGLAIGTKTGFMGWLRGGLERGEKVMLFEDEWRTPVYVTDICRLFQGIILDTTVLGQLECNILHVAGPERITRYDFGQKVCEIFDLEAELIEKKSQKEILHGAPRSPDVSLNTSLLGALGFRFCGATEGLYAMQRAEQERNLVSFS